MFEELLVKIVLSLLLFFALCPEAHAQFRGLGSGDHVKLRAAERPGIPIPPATDADLARAERDAPVPDPILENLSRRFGVTDDGLRVFGSGRVTEQGGVSASFNGHEAVLHVRW